MFGSSPLVVWLKPYMLTEILGNEVPEQQLTHRPATYTNYASHMLEVGDNKTRDTDATKRDYKAYGHARRPGGRRKAQEMDAESCETPEDAGAGGEGQGLVDVSGDVVSSAAQAVTTSGDAVSGDAGQGDNGEMESELNVNPLS